MNDDELNPADYVPDTTPGVLRQDKRVFTPGSTRARSEITKKRKERFIELLLEGHTVTEALVHPDIGVIENSYRKWRSLDREFAARVDLARSGAVMDSPTYDGTVASFMHHYFKMDLAWFHQAYYNEIESTPLGNILLALWPPAHGKGHVSGTELPTPSGWTTIDEIQVDDHLIGRNGQPTRVLEVHPWRTLDCYRVTFADGSTVTVDGDHLWHVSSRNLRSARGRYGEAVLDTRAMFHAVTANNRPVLRVPVADSFDLPEVDLGTDPYLFGAWLGDGTSSRCGTICSGWTDLPSMIAQFERAGYPVNVTSTDKPAPLITNARLREEIKALGVRNNKHIPPQFLRASRAQRFALLQGLMDTDGSTWKGQAEYAGMNKRLVDDVYELIRTLGFKCRRYTTNAQVNGRVVGLNYRLSFFPGMSPVFRLQRKLDAQRPLHIGDRHRWETVVAVERVDSVPTRCVRVDAPDSLYLVGRQMHVTHNTTSYENWATRKLCLDAEWRGTIASENLTIAQKILQRVKSRFEPDGPFPGMVRDFGPFRPQVGSTSMAQPWGSTYFNVFRKASHDERDYNLLALGRGSSIVSTRTDHLHIDDVQSTKTLGQTDAIEEWLRQDALSRPGEHGITTIAGTRVGEDDVYSRLLDDDDLHGILKVVKFKAIITDIETGEQRPLWPERYSMDQLERIRKKAGQESFDRNYMQAPGISNHNATFTTEMIDPCKNPMLSLHQPLPPNTIVYVSLDPAIGGVNCVMACEITRDGKMVVRRIREQSNLRTNEQIMQELNAVIGSITLTGAKVTDVIIEAMNFQRGLARDERLLDMQKHYGFALREHLTGINKYDENIGVPSMCGSFLRGEIVLPWADDELTRFEIGELVRQLRAWKPLKRGSKLRQDRVMALWFAWIVWQQRQKMDYGTDAASWRVKGVPWSGTKTSLIMPVGVRT